MELEELRALLARYDEGETTLEEESRIARHFATAPHDEEFESWRALFGFYAREREVESSQKIPVVRQRSRRRAWIPAVAAALVLGSVGYFAWTAQPPKATSEYGTFDDPEVALRETRKALELISANVNKGRESVEYLGKYEESKNVIFTK